MMTIVVVGEKCSPPSRTIAQESPMEDPLMSPEELICSMQADEICELLEELGVSLTPDQASELQALISKLGSVDIALNQLVQSEDRDIAAA